MNEEELKVLIQGGETATIEFKLNPPWAAEMAQRLCGFANSPLGGILIFGVEDATWKIKGLENPAATIDEVIKGISLVNPPVPLVEPDPQLVIVEGKTLVIARVPPNKGILYQAGGAYWLRRGTLTRPMSTAQVAEYLNRQGLISWETQVNSRATLDDLDLKKVERYLQYLAEVVGRPSRISDPIELLKLLECVASIVDPTNGKTNPRPTNAGMLLFGEAPRYFYPQAEIICTYYQDESGVRRYDDRRIISGTILEQIDQAHAFLKLYTPVAAHIEGFHRIEEAALPLEALREAVVNAVVHRDYSLRGEAIRIFYYANRVEIHSPGMLVPDLTLEELKQGKSRSKPRNPVIASLLRDMPGNYMERVGTGIPFIINQMQALNLPAPEFSQPGEFVVTFWKQPSPLAKPLTRIGTQSEQPPLLDEKVKSNQPGINQINSLAPSTLSSSRPAENEREGRQKRALEYMRQHGYITNREYQELTGVSESTATRDLEVLVERGRLKRTGRGPSRRYVLE
ncbi:MAG: putative DNA binding domain-containing protein [Chloroflexi bacterium]|nr:putative DNA binding domain-containing protein [Chloroflexota bacterium]